MLENMITNVEMNMTSDAKRKGVGLYDQEILLSQSEDSAEAAARLDRTRCWPRRWGVKCYDKELLAHGSKAQRTLRRTV